MRSFFLAAALFAALPAGEAQAQFRAVSTCPSAQAFNALSPQAQAYAAVDIYGTACVSGGGGSGGGGGAVYGVSAAGAAASENPLYDGLRAALTSPTPVGDGQKVGAMGTKTGKHVVMPYAPPELWVQGTSANAATGSAVTVLANPGALTLNVTDLECGRSDAGTAAIVGTIADTTPTTLGYMVLPNSGGGGGNNLNIKTPLVTGAGKSLTINFPATTTVYCNARGYQG